MVASAEKAVVCPVLIGRGDFIDSLDRVLKGVAAGSGQVLALAGEAGIGKSRMVAEVRSRFEADGGLILQGNCFEQDATLPYAAVLDLLRTCFIARSPDEIRECIGPDAPELTKLLPELSSVIPEAAPTAALDPEQEKRRIFLALTQFFSRLAGKQPLLVIIEDLHWSDDTSLEFLLQLARRARTLPLLVLVSYRSDEINASLGHTLAQLERERLITECELHHFGAAEVEEMIRAIFDLDAPIRADFLDAIYSLTEGNPFFIEEVLKSLVASGDIFYENGVWERKPLSELHIPRSVHDAVRVRTDQLRRETQEVLTVAAVTGRRFDFGLLQRVTERDERELLSIIKELMSAQLVVEESADRFAFRHALTQHVIYSDLLARERRTLHANIAEHMRSLYAGSIDSHLADLAHHFFEAERWDEAYYYCRRVGESAQTLFASGAAVEHLTRALEAATQLSVAVPAKLYRARGQSHELLGNFDAARSDYAMALDLARAASDGPSEWQALIDLGFLWAGKDYRRTGEFFRKALDLARTLEEPVFIGQSLNRLGNWLVNTGNAEEGLKAHADALLIFEEQDDDQGRADTLDLLAMANGLHGNIPESLRRADQAIALYRKLADNRGLVSSLASRGTWSSPVMHDVAASEHSSLEASLRDTSEALRIAQQIGWSSGLAFASFTSASVACGFGDFGGALRHAHESLRVATETSHEQWMVGANYTLGTVYLFMLAPDLALHHLEEALPVAMRLGSAWWTGNIVSYLAQAYLLNGDPGRAASTLKAVMTRDGTPNMLAERRMLWAWGELDLANGEFGGAIEVADCLTTSIPGSSGFEPVPSLLLLKGRALLGLRRAGEAAEVLAAGEAESLRRSDRVWLWQLRRELARAFEAAGQREEAAAASDAARTTIDEIAATIDDARLRDGFRGAAAASLPAKKQPTARQAEKAQFGGLTTREREVAALIAQGKSNREIADELVLGERTIETHVGNILSKLGFSSRAHVAAWAVETGLARHAS